jgi:archaellum component FlaC
MENENMTLEKIGSMVEKLDGRFDAVDKRLDQMDKRFDSIDGRLSGIDKRFDGVDAEVRGLVVLMEDMDDKFTLISEGQEIIQNILDNRVAHIEEVLEARIAA